MDDAKAALQATRLAAMAAGRERAKANKLAAAQKDVKPEEILAAGEVTNIPTGNVRPTMRPEVRPAEDSRARAAARMAVIMENIGDMDEGVDEFRVDPKIIPEDWCYEWKQRTVLGKEDPAYQVQLARMGWTAVPTDRHPSYMPTDGNHPIIERKGMVLMERPMELTRRAREIELRRARQQVQSKEEQLNAAPAGQMQRQKSDGSSLVRVNRSYEAAPRIDVPN